MTRTVHNDEKICNNLYSNSAFACREWVGTCPNDNGLDGISLESSLR